MKSSFIKTMSVPFSRQARFRLSVVLLICASIAVTLICAQPVKAHITDELSVKTRIHIERERIFFRLELAPGALIAPVFLDHLDPDRNRHFEESDIAAFTRYVASRMDVSIDGQTAVLASRQSRTCSLEDLITGIGTLYLDYSVPFAVEEQTPREVVYANRLENMIALYSLHISSDSEQGICIVSEERDEILQDRVRLVISAVKPLPVSASKDEGAVAASELESEDDAAEYSVPGVKTVIQRLKNGAFSPEVIALLLGLAFVVGILHAFTPGHGKALVGAYLVANRGSVFQAAVLGLVVTLTHTISIYLFGALSSTATYFFLPARVIPVMVLISGILIVGIGLWSFFRRLLGLDIDHAHLLPNLSVLQKNSVNILIDGSAAEAAELLTIVSDDDDVLTALRHAGADDVNICSPGCETHNISSRRRAERQSLRLIEKAADTGAVDAVVTGNVKKRRKIEASFQQRHGMALMPPENLKEAANMLVEVIRQFTERGPVNIPELNFSWKSLVMLGFAGGIVPCPDALAILLVSLAMGQLLLGMAIVLSFSVGLSLMLVSIGIMIVLSGKMLSRSGLFGTLAARVPYATSLFLSVLGLYMIVKILPQL